MMTQTAHLRILETTDLHMHLLAQDGFSGKPNPAQGLAPLADLIATRREGQHTTLLFDNGDFLQGTPLADQQAEAVKTGDTHLIATAFDALGYDAVTLGNHEFDYGLPVLNTVLDQMNSPAVCANITSDTPNRWVPFDILTRRLRCDDGIERNIKIGVTGFAPPLITTGRGLTSRNIVDAAKAIVPEMKTAGADIVIVLCHAGVGARGDGPENAGRALGYIRDIDALLLGHTHDQFPDCSRTSSHDVSQVYGTIFGKPTVMAGYHGTSLGEIDLHLRYDPYDGWHVTRHLVTLLKPLDHALPYSTARLAIERATKPTIAALKNDAAHVVTQSPITLHNDFACVVPDPISQLFATTMRDACAKAIGQSGILAAVAPFQPAGAQGKRTEISLPPGPITRRDIQLLFPFTDQLCAVARTGAEIRDWLERGAAHYNQITDVHDNQLLISRHSARYHCDAIYGLQYQIDLSQPARFDAHGTCIAPAARRISHVTLNGERLKDHATYKVATTSFRAKGGGGFPQIPQRDILWKSQLGLREILTQALQAGVAGKLSVEEVWHFKPMPDATALIEAGEAAKRHAPRNISPLHVPHADLMRLML